MMLMQIKGEENNMNSLTVVEHSGERVLTTEQLAEAYGCTARNINDNFNNNRERFEAGKHFYCLEGEDLSAFKHDPENIGLVASNASRLYLWTKRGAARHSKMLGTDRAWEMFDELEENYFNPQQKPMSELELMQASIKRLVDMEHKQDELSNQQAHDELLTVKDVAKVLHVGINAANSLVQSGVIPHIKLNGAKVRRRALETWMASMEGKDLSDPANPVPITKGDAA